VLDNDFVEDRITRRSDGALTEVELAQQLGLQEGWVQERLALAARVHVYSTAQFTVWRRLWAQRRAAWRAHQRQRTRAMP
jgi:hypothetical protein